MKYSVKLKTIDEIKSFVKDMESFSSDINVYKGHYVTDGKSLLAYFAIDTSTGIEVQLISSNEDELVNFANIIKKYE